jgi:hypothetical protein
MKIQSILGSLMLVIVCVNPAYAIGPGWAAAYGTMSALMFEQVSVNKAAYVAGGAGIAPIVMNTVVGGAVAGFGTAKLMNDRIFSDCQNPKACDAAKIGTYVGATIGTTGVMITVATIGVNATSLATIGAVVGSGIAAGAAALVAAPIVAAIAVGWATYWWFS